MGATAEKLIDLPSLALSGAVKDAYAHLLTGDALAFIATLESEFGGHRTELLSARSTRQALYEKGELPDFLAKTQNVGESDWTILGTPIDLKDRRVEVAGSLDRKMMIKAFNSGANVFIADFDHPSSQTWDQVLQGHANLYDYARGTLEYTDPNTHTLYRLSEPAATLKMRPRGLNRQETQATLDGEPVSASLFDFGLFIFHNAHELIERGTGAYFYLPRIESRQEAELWNDVLTFAERALGIAHGCFKATARIETLNAAFEMDEILFALRDHIVGLNLGRQDVPDSNSKDETKDDLLPDRGQVGMGEAFLKAYSLLLIKTCHRRGAHAIGGAATRFRAEKDDIDLSTLRPAIDREAANGFDGTLVAHPALVPVARDVFDALIPQANQLHRSRNDLTITPEDLLALYKDGPVTEAQE